MIHIINGLKERFTLIKKVNDPGIVIDKNDRILGILSDFDARRLWTLLCLLEKEFDEFEDRSEDMMKLIEKSPRTPMEESSLKIYLRKRAELDMLCNIVDEMFHGAMHQAFPDTVFGVNDIAIRKGWKVVEILDPDLVEKMQRKN